jgi:hypothetical protein
MRNRVRSGRWQQIQRGVYATFSGEPLRETVLWAALLRAGPDAVLSHQTAAERHGLIDEPSPVISITVPASRHPAQAKIPGVVIHRSDAILRTRHPAMLPPCTRVEDTVLDLIQVASSFDDAYVWICRAIGRRRTTADRIALTMATRKKMRWRREIGIALGDVKAGALSVLEYRYVHRVERPHRLPVARRQARIRHGTGSRYLDNLYEGFAVCVELDGTAAHPEDEQWRDKRRDTANAVRGILTLRFGILDVGDRRCQTAVAVASVLRSRGWPGTPHPCSRPGLPGHTMIVASLGQITPETGHDHEVELFGGRSSGNRRGGHAMWRSGSRRGLWRRVDAGFLALGGGDGGGGAG